MLNAITGMSATGVTLTLDVTGNANVAADGTITYTGSGVVGNVIVKINKASGTEATQTVSVTVPAHTATAAELANASIATAKGLVPTTKSVVEGTDTNLLTMLNAITGMSATGVTLTLDVTGNANVAANGAISYTGSGVVGNVIVHINKASGTEQTATVAVTLAQDTTAPTRTFTAYDGTNHTITYTFSEPIKLKNQGTGAIKAVAAEDLSICRLVSGTWTHELSTPDVTAVSWGTGNVLTSTYTGTLASDTYSIAAFGYYFVDLAGNVLTPWISENQSFVVAPKIATGTSTIANGQGGPIWVDITGTNFKFPPSSTNELTVDVGSTGLNYAGLACSSATVMSVQFNGTAVAGDVTIQANTSRFDPASASVSNTLTINVPPAAPTFVSAATSDATHIVITMSSALTGTAGAPAAFTVASVASNPAVTGVAVSGTSVTLTLDHSIVGTDTPTVAYTHTSTTDLTNGTLVADFAARSVTNSVALAIGDYYRGGIIAYIDETGLHGLIAATVDQSTAIYWHATNDGTTGASGTAIGTGEANTEAIVTLYGAESNAARLCYDLVLNGYSDWYLPSKDELNQLYLNKTAVFGFASAYYWSSTEYNTNLALNQSFDFVYQGINDKTNAGCARAVRAF